MDIHPFTGGASTVGKKSVSARERIILTVHAYPTKLPTLNDIKDEFEQLADKLGVK